MKNIFFISAFFLFSCKTKPSDGDIKNMAKEMLKQEILTPSTAKFPPNDEIKLEREKGDSTFRVSSHVDAQNAFGAMIRQNWEIHLWYIGGAFSDSLSWRKLYE